MAAASIPADTPSVPLIIIQWTCDPLPYDDIEDTVVDDGVAIEGGKFSVLSLIIVALPVKCDDSSLSGIFLLFKFYTLIIYEYKISRLHTIFKVWIIRFKQFNYIIFSYFIIKLWDRA